MSQSWPLDLKQRDGISSGEIIGSCRPATVPARWRHCRSFAGVREKAIGCTIQWTKSTGTKRGTRGTHPGWRRRRGGLGISRPRELADDGLPEHFGEGKHRVDHKRERKKGIGSFVGAMRSLARGCKWPLSTTGCGPRRRVCSVSEDPNSGHRAVLGQGGGSRGNKGARGRAPGTYRSKELSHSKSRRNREGKHGLSSSPARPCEGEEGKREVTLTRGPGWPVTERKGEGKGAGLGRGVCWAGGKENWAEREGGR